jgi:hypothetical protein
MDTSRDTTKTPTYPQLEADLAQAKVALQQAEADRDRARLERDTVRHQLDVARHTITVLEERLRKSQELSECSGTQVDPELEFLVVTNKPVVVQSAEARNHELALLGELLRQMQRSGSGVPPTLPASGSAIRASNGRVYAMTEVADPLDSETEASQDSGQPTAPVIGDPLVTNHLNQTSGDTGQGPSGGSVSGVLGPLGQEPEDQGVDNRTYSLEEGDLQIDCEVGFLLDGRPVDK